MSEVAELIKTCERSGVKISVAGRNLKIDAPKGVSDSIKDGLRRHKADIIKNLSARFGRNGAASFVRHPNETSFVETLDRMIAKGAAFDVSIDDFQITGAANLTDAEKHFLQTNKPEILCTLRQCLLQKYLLPSDLQMFICEVRERAAILSDGATIEPPFEVLNEIVRDWFTDMMEEIVK